MNQLEALVKEITIADNIVLVDLETEGCSMSALMIDSDGLPEWLAKEKKVMVAIKESEISIATNFSGGISMRNRLICAIKHIQKGKLLSIVTLAFGNSVLKSAITTRSIESLNLAEGQQVTALIKANEVSLMKINS